MVARRPRLLRPEGSPFLRFCHGKRFRARRGRFLGRRDDNSREARGLGTFSASEESLCLFYTRLYVVV
jgi:hypothetical protein